MPYTNPVVRGMNPDPSICRAGDDFYLATSTMNFYPGVPIHHSKDLVNWRLIGHCLTRPAHFQPDQTNGAPMIYAPTLRYHDGVFYMVTTNVHGGGNFFVTATDPAGPWSDPIVVDQEVFDPSLLFDTDGKVYYSRRGSFEHKDVIQAEIDIQTGKLLTEYRSLGVGMVSDDAEGPHVYHIGDWYYLMQAEGGSRFLHMETISRSRSPWGPFEPCPHNPILSQHEAWWHPVRSLGHADLVEAADGTWWAVFLGTRHASYDSLTILGRETFLARVDWVDGWPVFDKQAMRELSIDSPTPTLYPWDPEPSRDDFHSENLGLQWTQLAVPTPGVLDLRERPGYVRLRGQAGFTPAGSAFVGFRQKDLTFTASTLLEFEPAGDNEEAGVSVFQTSAYRYDLRVTRRDGRRVVSLHKTVGDLTHESDLYIAPDGPLELRISGDPAAYAFAFRAAGASDWTPVGAGLTQLIAAEVASTWTGIFLGLYSTGNGQTCQAPADFDWFEYNS
ncbi:glycoside hydrolase 43 family protein [Capsulimonas corticalis]|uniref:Glycoside hydrolase 43 family protein n=1 Tax=Capsulimonas corticalis TaxID=2219043 RepID=A0A402CR82_9BACT|nr:glycoside hydrolase family 43 protein [Capsulimonas corticalis]BDI34558.1 glycoside hydrolase 43 family protein [Capsulimonas corticalis]